MIILRLIGWLIAIFLGGVVLAEIFAGVSVKIAALFAVAFWILGGIWAVKNTFKKKDSKKGQSEAYNIYNELHRLKWSENIFYDKLYDTSQPITGDHCDYDSFVIDHEYGSEYSIYYMKCKYAGKNTCVHCTRRTEEMVNEKYKYGSSSSCKVERGTHD